MVLAHWNSSSHVDMYHHWYTLTCFWARQWLSSFSLKLYAQRKSSKYQFYSSWFNSYMAQTRTSTALTANTLTITPLIRAIATTRSNHLALQLYNFRVWVQNLKSSNKNILYIWCSIPIYLFWIQIWGLYRVMVFNATFNNITVISWRPVLQLLNSCSTVLWSQWLAVLPLLCGFSWLPVFVINLYIYFVVMWSIRIGTFLYYTNDSNWYLVMASIISMSFKSINTNNKTITHSRNSSNIQNFYHITSLIEYISSLTQTHILVIDMYLLNA